MRRPVAVCSLALLAVTACGGKRDRARSGESERASPAAEPPPALAIANAAARRDFGLDALVPLARTGPVEQRSLAITALGRVGGDDARAALVALLDDSSPEIQVAALGALWTTGDGGAAAAVGAHCRRAGDPAVRAAALEVLGHIGTAAELPLLIDALRGPDGELRAAAALALGVFGRRKIAIPAAAVTALLSALDGANSGDLRYGVAYALARQHEPPEDPKAVEALVALARDDDAEVRAVAVAGLARRGAAAGYAVSGALGDADWRVRVQAVRALAGDGSTPAMRAALARWLAAEWPVVHADPARVRSGFVHPVLDALTALRPHAGERPVREALAAVYADAAPRPGDGATVAAVRCHAAYARGRVDDLLACSAGDGGWPAHLPRILAAEIASGDALVAFAGDADPRVRAAAIARALRDAEVAPQVLEAAAAALASEHPVEVGSVVDALAARARARADASFAVFLDGRARSLVAGDSSDAELLIGLFDALAAMGVDKLDKSCRMALAHPNRTVRAKARECVESLSGRDVEPRAPASAPPAPPVDPGDVLGKRVVWRMQTSKGPIVIELDPVAAPWHVAVLASLARAGFYDGLSWHRVVADFVVQGGDPTGSGWGGPGYLVPAEPSAPARFDRGAVGIADAGLDTGGCQIFIMHSRAPHLEGRYTRVGAVTEGIEVVDRLIVGDLIEKVDVEVEGAAQ